MGDSSMRVVSPQRHPALGRYISIYHDYHVVLHGLYLLVARTTNEWQHHSEPRRANVHCKCDRLTARSGASSKQRFVTKCRS